jgi:hypothetical protein
MGELHHLEAQRARTQEPCCEPDERPDDHPSAGLVKRPR